MKLRGCVNLAALAHESAASLSTVHVACLAERMHCSMQRKDCKPHQQALWGSILGKPHGQASQDNLLYFVLARPERKVEETCCVVGKHVNTF